MSSEEKMEDRIHVPWYDTEEWKNVYNQLYKEGASKEDMKEALNTLLIWKSRMPRLYGLIEGTLILVQCLTMEDKDLCDDLSKNIIASAVLRFLNVCLCNSKSQKTFFHVAKSKNLPDWIVDIRHNFAHSQILPSAEMLNRAVQFLFNWLKENYWDQQSKTINDFIRIPKIKFHPLFHMYEQIVELEDKDYSATKLRRKLSELKINFHKSKYVLLRRIALALIADKCDLDTSIIPIIIIRNENFLNNAKITNDGYIVEEYQYCWNQLIFSLIELKIFYKFLKMLVMICCNNNRNEDTGKKSAAWIKSICNVVDLDKKTNILETNKDRHEFQEFAYWTIAQPNIYMKYYIKELLTLGKFSDEFIFYTCQVAEALIPQPYNENPKDIYTIECFKDILDDDMYKEIRGEKISRSIGGWQIVEDTYKFEGVPLGKRQ